jgi:hypothetical protein
MLRASSLGSVVDGVRAALARTTATTASFFSTWCLSLKMYWCPCQHIAELLAGGRIEESFLVGETVLLQILLHLLGVVGVGTGEVVHDVGLPVFLATFDAAVSSIWPRLIRVGTPDGFMRT